MELTRLTLQLPLPSPVLSPNTRSHWAVKAKAVKAARTAAFLESKRVLEGRTAPRWKKARITAAFFLAGRRKTPDPDNAIAALKAYQDGAADAGIVENDRVLWPGRPSFTFVERMPRVEITIEPED